MKALLCRTCKTHAMLPNGKPYLIGRAPTFHQRTPYLYKCSVCEMANEISASEFNLLPELTASELKEHGVRM